MQSATVGVSDEELEGAAGGNVVTWGVWIYCCAGHRKQKVRLMGGGGILPITILHDSQSKSITWRLISARPHSDQFSQ